jgi:uncharacterized protein YceH (UPF0502 family)
MSDESPQDTPTPPAEPERLVLGPVVRRVLGVLIEKSLATPDYYPMTTKAIVTAANQKNNRLPVTQLTADEVETALSELQRRRIVLAVKSPGGRGPKWRQELQRVYNLQGREQAVLGELLLRGPQAEGELRARASRMKEIDDLDSLHEVLASMRDREPSFAVRLSPEGQVRGVRHAHDLYPAEELERLRVQAAEQGEASEATAAASVRGGRVENLQGRVAELEARLARIEAALGLDAQDEGE